VKIWREVGHEAIKKSLLVFHGQLKQVSNVVLVIYAAWN
jgi:hypothetical protein